MEIQLNNISHHYGKGAKVLNNISLTFSTGITGLLGSNGAGKSSLLNILATVFSPQYGTYIANNIDILKKPFAVRKSLGYLPQNFGFLPELTTYEYLYYIGLLKGCSSGYLKERIIEMLGVLNILETKNSQIKTLSGGMRQRVGIAQSIINQPSVLLLDEPMIGLDPGERNSFNHLIAEMAKYTTIIISSHIIEDIENTCENVILLETGNVKYVGTTANLIDTVNGIVYEQLINREEVARVVEKKYIIRTKSIGDKVLVRYFSFDNKNAIPVVPMLEDAFLYQTKFENAKSGF